MKIVKVPIDRVQPWDKNPRGIKAEDYDRLKKQILKLGVYKPLLAYKEKGGYVVLGGNMRIRALKELGVKEVEVSVVTPKDEAQKIEFALSDNDRAGYYEEQALAELVFPHIKDLDLGEFKVDMGRPLALKEVLEGFGPIGPESDPAAGFDYEQKYAVTVECKDEAAQRETYETLSGMGYKCRVVVV